jgi:hypothetical protein
MASSSANDIIERALVKLGVFHPGESIPASIQSQVFAELNDMLERWVLERLMVPADIIESFALTSGKADYTYGTGGDFDSPAPDSILPGAFIRSGSTDFPLHQVTLDTYRARPTKGAGARPEIFAVNPTPDLNEIWFWPTPTATSDVHFRVRKQLTSFSDRTTSVSLPKGFRGGLVSNLAIEVSSNFGKKVGQELAVQAMGFVRSIKRANRVSGYPMRTDLGAMTWNARNPRFNSGPFV